MMATTFDLLDMVELPLRRGEDKEGGRKLLLDSFLLLSSYEDG